MTAHSGTFFLKSLGFDNGGTERRHPRATRTIFWIVYCFNEGQLMKWGPNEVDRLDSDSLRVLDDGFCK